MKRLRKQINRIDDDLLRLIASRLRVAKKIGIYKKKHNLPVRDVKREREIINERTKALAKLGFNDSLFVKHLFNLLFAKSRSVQK
ncbi:chorismate mutase [Candidatus Woesearchaeota archaeon]|nr:chorismate mutase [Candidatus Woesearchaeota archaeon]